MSDYIFELVEHFTTATQSHCSETCQQTVGLPSRKRLYLLVKEITSLTFPRHFDPESEVGSIKNHLELIENIVVEQVHCGICFICGEKSVVSCEQCKESAKAIAKKFMMALPQLQQDLLNDANSAFYGDPAAVHVDEVVFAYPGVRAMIHHRIAHLLYKLGASIIPRIISELAHSKTGIDIHPGAEIGHGFFIDHGTGVVIGETAIIGSGVKIYQGVTLGAKSFPTDSKGNPMKGINRHPIIADEVTIYAGATILGRIVVGKGATIGGNVWLTECVPEGKTVIQK
ncbi:MAG: hypothetical protein KAG61_08960 [Bacteriovoracaceae bacterium]|nr:hypothetical protein [Bacteriovoracaceae bacterium]